MRSRADIELDHAGIVMRLLRLDRDILSGVPMSLKTIARRANHPIVCPAPLAKIFLFTSDPNHLYILLIPPSREGAYRDRHGR
jgi:hypothetical protein